MRFDPNQAVARLTAIERAEHARQFCIDIGDRRMFDDGDRRLHVVRVSELFVVRDAAAVGTDRLFRARLLLHAGARCVGDDEVLGRITEHEMPGMGVFVGRETIDTSVGGLWERDRELHIAARAPGLVTP
jgi:hypothetical protein